MIYNNNILLSIPVSTDVLDRQFYNYTFFGTENCINLVFDLKLNWLIIYSVVLYCVLTKSELIMPD